MKKISYVGSWTQIGFLAVCSSREVITQTHVYRLHLIYASLDQGHCSIRIFHADFKKGFHLVHHNLMINELQKLQVFPAIIRWIRSFLTSREQSVKIGSFTPTWKHVNGSLPHGTKLGPLLFAILIIPLLKDWSGRIKFVDDATVLEIIPRCSPSLMPVLVDEISLFASSRGMKLNSKKCKEMIISFLKYRFPMDNPIYIDGIPVQSVSSMFKLLGLLPGDGLSWSDHVDSVIKKANSRLYAQRISKKAGLCDKDLLPYSLLSSGLRLSMLDQRGRRSPKMSLISSSQSKKGHCVLSFQNSPIRMH